jgi:hypothetical protein
MNLQIRRFGMIGKGYTDQLLSESEVRAIVAQAFAEHDMTGKRVLFITPDATRSGPMDRCSACSTTRWHKVAALDYLIALGTHMAMDEAACSGSSASRRREGNEVRQRAHFNHEWEKTGRSCASA